jgi:hypothetical protein
MQASPFQKALKWAAQSKTSNQKSGGVFNVGNPDSVVHIRRQIFYSREDEQMEINEITCAAVRKFGSFTSLVGRVHARSRELPRAAKSWTLEGRRISNAGFPIDERETPLTCPDVGTLWGTAETRRRPASRRASRFGNAGRRQRYQQGVGRDS